MKTIGVKGIINPMSDNEMKLVKGGAGMNNNGTLPLELFTGHEADPADDGGGGYAGLCAFSVTPTSKATCAPDPATAEKYAGKDGWWCCNCAEAIALCSSNPFSWL